MEKVISTKISTEKFELLQKYARECYIKNLITQPTVSVLLRSLVMEWVDGMERVGGMNEQKWRSICDTKPRGI